ncbi:MAG TPA: MFS transporter [Planctomycetota bacterium]|nr:MFS transporter [Planctomycetota bacterium]
MTAIAQRETQRQVRVLAAYAAFTYPFACVPFLWFYFRDHGIGIDGYANLISVYYVVMVVAEVPTGLLADRFGRKPTLVLGPAVLAAGFAVLRLGDDFASFALGEALLGLGHALLSGAPSALLYDTLARAGRTERFLLVEARLHGWRTLGTAASFLAGGVVAALAGNAATIPLTAALCACAGLVALAVREPPRQRTRAPALLLAALGELRLGEARWIALYYVVLFCLLRYCFHTYQPYLDAAGQEEPLVLGLLFCALNAFAVPWSRAVPGLLRRWGERALLWAMPLSLALSLVVMAFAVGGLGVLLFFVHQAPFGAHWSVIQTYANRHLSGQSRATALSVLSFAGRIAFAAVFPVLGWLQARSGLTAAYAAAGIGGALATIAVMRRQPR